jgi:hypothetical protein
VHHANSFISYEFRSASRPPPLGYIPRTAAQAFRSAIERYTRGIPLRGRRGRSPRTAIGNTAHPHQRVDQIVDLLPLLRHGRSIAGRTRRRNRRYLARLTRFGSLPRLLAKEVCDIAGSLIRRQERDDHLSQSAALASKPVPYLRQREIVFEMCAQFHQREPSGMLAPAIICAVLIRIIDVRERGGAERGGFNRATLSAVGCGHQWDNSYRRGCRAALYKTMQGRPDRHA